MWQELCLEESQGRVTIHAYSSMPFLLLEQLPSQNQVMRREILQLSCKAQKKEKDTLNAEGKVERVKNFNPAENRITYGKRDQKLGITGLNR